MSGLANTPPTPNKGVKTKEGSGGKSFEIELRSFVLGIRIDPQPYDHTDSHSITYSDTHTVP